MGFFNAIKKRQDQKLFEAALQVMNPYVFIPIGGQVNWMRWEIIPQAEAVGVFPKHDGLPVLMTKKDCEAVNGSTLPAYWGEVQYAWRTEAQKCAFYAKYPERFRQQQPEYPTQEQMKEVWDAYKSRKPGAMAEVLRKRQEEKGL